MTDDGGVLSQSQRPGAALRRDPAVLVQQLYARYCFAIDSGNVDMFADTFTPDGRFDIVGVAVHHGRDAIRAAGARRSGAVLHTVFNVAVADAADAAVGAEAAIDASAYVCMVSRADCTPAAYGWYDDEIVFAGDGSPHWRLKRLRYLTTTHEYAAGLGLELATLPADYVPAALATSSSRRG